MYRTGREPQKGKLEWRNNSNSRQHSSRWVWMKISILFLFEYTDFGLLNWMALDLPNYYNFQKVRLFHHLVRQSFVLRLLYIHDSIQRYVDLLKLMAQMDLFEISHSILQQILY
jgi:protein-tyrosine phosphatase